ncbi:N-acetylmuramidase domain-containing protein [Rubrivivax gelatinosus]
MVSKMCSSEKSQLGMLASFIENKPAAWINPKNRKLGRHPSLLQAVRAKNWQMIAFNYNGSSYKKNFYDQKMEQAYAHHKKLSNENR